MTRQRHAPLSLQIAALLTAFGIGHESATRAEQFFYWVHVCSILGFLVYIPGSKHRHMFLAAINVYFRSMKPKGTLPPADVDHPPIGVGAVEEFTWKNMLDLYSCTECGRCQAACPAYAAGLPLSPKLLITDLRDHLIDKTHGTAQQPLLGGAIAEETLWACTTCRACMEVCPVHIEHIPKIVDMRRQLVEQARMQPMLQEALSNLQTQRQFDGQVIAVAGALDERAELQNQGRPHGAGRYSVVCRRLRVFRSSSSGYDASGRRTIASRRRRFRYSL